MESRIRQRFVAERGQDLGRAVAEATSHLKKVTAFARYTRSGERGTEAAPALSELKLTSELPPGE